MESYTFENGNLHNSYTAVNGQEANRNYVVHQLVYSVLHAKCIGCPLFAIMLLLYERHRVPEAVMSVKVLQLLDPEQFEADEEQLKRIIEFVELYAPRVQKRVLFQ